MEKNRRATTGFSVLNSIDDGRTINEAVGRAGHNKNIKGHILEVKFKNNYNRNPLNRLKGNKARLTKSPTAVRDDIVVMNDNKVVKRFQLKDTPSKSGTRDTARRMSKGQYKGTNVVGTTETAARVEGIKDSGISTKTTELLACEANGANPLKKIDLLGYNARKVGKSGALISGVISAISNGKKVLKKEKDLDEGIASVGVAAGKGGISTAAGSIADAAVTMVLAPTPASPFAKFAGSAVGALTSIATNKGLNLIGNEFDSILDKKVERKLRNDYRAYNNLKSSKKFR